MKHIHARHKVMSVTAALLLVGLALPGYALMDVPPDPAKQSTTVTAAAEPKVLITELQTGAQTASDEFIELYNASDVEMAIGGWQIRYINVATQTDTTLVATIAEHVVIPAQTHYVLHTPSVALPVHVLGQQYNATLSNKDKAIALFAPDKAACQLRVRDAIAWGASTHGEGAPVVAADVDIAKHIYRYRTTDSTYVDTNTNVHDVGVHTVLPFASSVGSLNSQLIATPETTWPIKGAGSSLLPIPIKGCGEHPANPPTPSEPEVPQLPPASSPPAVVSPSGDDEPAGPKVPEANIGLLAPQISELLPNPAKPQTDANDEFIELYNPNAVRFELSGFILEAGSKTKKRFTFPDGVMLAPKSFTAFTSVDTKLALSNTEGQVWLLDPLGRVIGQSDVYQKAKDGQAWLTAEGAWQWTTMPTPNAINIVKKPTAKKTASTAATAKTQTASSVKSATTHTPSSPKPAVDARAEGSKEDSSFNPLHPGILALTGVLAVLYAVYEYRRDLANKFHQLRANRAARRAARQDASRR